MEGSPLTFTVFKGPVSLDDDARDVRIWLCLSGALTVEVAREDGAYAASELTSDDLLLVNAGVPCHARANDARFIRFSLDAAAMQQCFPNRVLSFSCSSVEETNDSVQQLRALLTEVVVAEYEGGELVGSELRAIFYHIASLLMGRFSASSDRGITDRMGAIRAFVAQHYAENLSVERMGRAFFVTPQYFSKYFKEQSGETFHRYLSRVRVRRAADALAQTDDTVLKVALDSGFPNAESLRKAFLQEYGMTPAAYRRDRQARQAGTAPVETASVEEAVLLMGDRRPALKPGEEHLAVDAARQVAYIPYWSDALNLGELVALENYEVREQLVKFQSILKFGYVRFGVSHAFISGDDAMRQRALYFEDQQIDSLFRLHARPWIMMEYTPDVPAERYRDYLHSQISHYANRVDMDNVLNWRFELSAGPDGMANIQGYLRCFTMLSGVLENIGHREGLIGPNLSLNQLDEIERWATTVDACGLALPVQTFRVDPGLSASDSAPAARRVSDSSYIKDRLYALGRRLPAYRDAIASLRITEWDSAYPGPNPLNDSCFRGAATVKNLIDCFGDVGSLAPTQLFDSMDAFSHRKGLLFGGDGLVSRHGIPKPAFYAYEIMNRAGKYYLERGEHAAVFTNGNANYQIICHNCKHLGAAYYTHESEFAASEVAGLFEDERPLTVTVRMTNVRDGVYLIKKRSVSTTEGSIQDELLRMGASGMRDVHPNDLDYLRRVTIPRISLSEERARGGVLEVAVELAPNEFAHLHAIYQF